MVRNPQYSVLEGHVLDRLRDLPDESVQCVVTSPPYWGLRDYGIPPSVWGGDPDCVHDWADASWKADRWGEHDDDTPGAKQRTNGGSLGHRGGVKEQSVCSQCGAWLGCFGLEPTPELYVEHAVMVFREVRRVLRSDGTLWLNIGDSYAGSWGAQGGPSNLSLPPSGVYADKSPTRDPKKFGLKPKDLVGIPWRVAFALQADGWWLRRDIIWHKPNPMPESALDRCTTSHEYIFHLSKSEKYYYDNEAIEEPCESGPSDIRKMQESLPRIGGKHKDLVDPPSKANSETNIGRKRSVGGKLASADGDENRASATARFGRGAGWRDDPSTTPLVRNKRSVWKVATQSYSEAHFATYPEKLIEPCILAGTKVGDTVLDPFGGSGTTGVVALRYHRNAILIEIKPDYVQLLNRRVQGDNPLFNTSTSTPPTQGEFLCNP